MDAQLCVQGELMDPLFTRTPVQAAAKVAASNGSRVSTEPNWRGLSMRTPPEVTAYDGIRAKRVLSRLRWSRQCLLVGPWIFLVLGTLVSSVHGAHDRNINPTGGSGVLQTVYQSAAFAGPNSTTLVPNLGGYWGPGLVSAELLSVLTLTASTGPE